MDRNSVDEDLLCVLALHKQKYNLHIGRVRDRATIGLGGQCPPTPRKKTNFLNIIIIIIIIYVCSNFSNFFPIKLHFVSLKTF